MGNSNSSSSSSPMDSNDADIESLVLLEKEIGIFFAMQAHILIMYLQICNQVAYTQLWNPFLTIQHNI